MIDQQKNFADKAQTEFRFGAIDQRLEETMRNLSKRLDGIDNALAASGGKLLGKTEGVGGIGTIVLGVFVGLSALASLGTLISALAHGVK